MTFIKQGFIKASDISTITASKETYKVPFFTLMYHKNRLQYQTEESRNCAKRYRRDHANRQATYSSKWMYQSNIKSNI